jgi:transposase, IS30 family
MGTHYKHLSMEERTMIQMELEQGCTLRAIAVSVQRPPSTISRELKRNGWTNPATEPRRRGRPRVAGGYRATEAQNRATGLAATPRCPSRLAMDGPLWPLVVDLLRTRHSPEQIAGILCRMYPDEPTLQVSHETIYTAIYAMPRGELRSELIACLRQSRKSRRPRARGADRRGTIPNMTSIHDRPAEVDERLVPGHWEGDLIKGARNASAIGTLVERTSLFVTLAKMENASAEAAVAGFSLVLNRIDTQRRLSLTYDQGREMAHHERLSATTGIKVFFADPHSPWQRGINENTNGLLRQYFPKGTDLSHFTQPELDAVAWQINTRPRKSLGWKCPAELFMPNDFCFKRHFQQLVALRT